MSQAPVFVKIEEFKELTKVLKTIDTKLKDVEKAINEIKTLREKESQQISEWDSGVEDIRGKLAEINNELFQ